MELNHQKYIWGLVGLLLKYRLFDRKIFFLKQFLIIAFLNIYGRAVEK
jgi:hypothetical protein